MNYKQTSVMGQCQPNLKVDYALRKQICNDLIYSSVQDSCASSNMRKLCTDEVERNRKDPGIIILASIHCAIGC